MKEEVIKELVGNCKLSNRNNLQLQQKVELLQKENDKLKTEMGELHQQSNTHAMMTTREPSSKVEL